MNYDTMTIESLADDCFRRSGYKINRADLISRITHLCENHESKVNVTLASVSKCGCGGVMEETVEGLSCTICG